MHYPLVYLHSMLPPVGALEYEHYRGIYLEQRDTQWCIPIEPNNPFINYPYLGPIIPESAIDPKHLDRGMLYKATADIQGTQLVELTSQPDKLISFNPTETPDIVFWRVPLIMIPKDDRLPLAQPSLKITRKNAKILASRLYALEDEENNGNVFSYWLQYLLILFSHPKNRTELVEVEYNYPEELGIKQANSSVEMVWNNETKRPEIKFWEYST